MPEVPDTVLSPTAFAAEIVHWPLLHGSMLLEENAASIRTRGLRASGGDRAGVNTFDYDVALGRQRSIFLQPIGTAARYGFGRFLLADPAAIQLPGVLGRLRDVGEEWTEICRMAEGSTNICEEFANYPLLQKRIAAAKDTAFKEAREKGVSDRFFDHAVDEWSKKRLLVDPIVLKFLKRGDLSPAAFCEALGKKIERLGWTFRDYICRSTATWFGSEELMAPDNIPAELILGACYGSKYERWRLSRSPEVEERISAWETLAGRPA